MDASFEALNKPFNDENLSFLNDGYGQMPLQLEEFGKSQNGLITMEDSRVSKATSNVSSYYPESVVGTPGLADSGERPSVTDTSFRRHGRSPRGSLSFSNGSSFGPGIPLNWELLEIGLDVDFLTVFAQLFGDSWNAWAQIHKSCGTNGIFGFILTNIRPIHR